MQWFIRQHPILLEDAITIDCNEALEYLRMQLDLRIIAWVKGAKIILKHTN